MPDPASIDRPWLSTYPPGVPATYRYPVVPLTRFLDDAARDFPDVIATDLAGATLDYAALLEHVDRCASAFAALDIGKGDRVGVWLPNLPAAPITLFGLWRLGAVPILLPLRLPGEPVGEAPSELVVDTVGAALAATDAQALVTDTSRVAAISAIRHRLPSLGHVVAARREAWLPLGRRVRAAARGRGPGRVRATVEGVDALLFEELLAAASPFVRQTLVDEHDLAAIAPTRREGELRYVPLTVANLVANAFQARLWIPDIQAGRERVLAALPLSEIAGTTLVVLTAALSAATLVLRTNANPRRTLATIARTRPTLFPGNPDLYRLLVEHPRTARADLSSLRVCLAGGAPLPADLVERVEAATRGARVREAYGLAEASPLTHANPIYGRGRPGTIGLPISDTVAIVVDDADPTRPLPDGEVGRLAITGPQVAAGYLDDPGASAARFVDGWLLAPDLAVHDGEGHFRIVGDAGEDGGGS